MLVELPGALESRRAAQMLSAERTCLWPEGSALGRTLLCEFRMGWIWDSIAQCPGSCPSRASPPGQ